MADDKTVAKQVGAAFMHKSLEILLTPSKSTLPRSQQRLVRIDFPEASLPVRTNAEACAALPSMEDSQVAIKALMEAHGVTRPLLHLD